jgi:spectinomycin phosphotransferase
MLEKPDLPDETIISGLQSGLGLHGVQPTFLLLGADINTAVYRVNLENGTALFLKLRKGDFTEITVAVRIYLKEYGTQAIIPQLRTLSGQLWVRLDPYKMILYPFVEGRNSYEVDLSDRQWMAFGAALKAIHTTQLLPALHRLIPVEVNYLLWREKVRWFQAQIEGASFNDSTP